MQHDEKEISSFGGTADSTQALAVDVSKNDVDEDFKEESDVTAAAAAAPTAAGPMEEEAAEAERARKELYPDGRGDE